MRRLFVQSLQTSNQIERHASSWAFFVILIFTAFVVPVQTHGSNSGKVVGISHDIQKDTTSLYFVDANNGSVSLFKEFSPRIRVDPANIVVDSQAHRLFAFTGIPPSGRGLVSVDLLSGDILSNLTLDYNDLTGLAFDPVYGLTAYRFEFSFGSLPFGTINASTGQFLARTKLVDPTLVPCGVDPSAHIRYFAFPSPPNAEYFTLDLETLKLKLRGQNVGFPLGSVFLPSSAMLFGLSTGGQSTGFYDVYRADPISGYSGALNIFSDGECLGALASTQAFDPVSGDYWFFPDVANSESVLYQVNVMSRTLVRKIPCDFDAVVFYG